MTAALNSAIVTDLAAEVSGPVLGPQDVGYDAARSVHNGLVDRRPALIVRCRTTGDIVTALVLARETGLEVSIRGGGHNVAGRAVTDGGVMVDLAEMKNVEIDPGARDSAGPGWRDLGRAERRGGRAWAGGHGRRDLHHRYRRLHARRRSRLADGKARARSRQPARRRARHGGRSGTRRRRRLASRPLLGAPWGRRQLRGRGLVHLPAAPAARRSSEA